MIPTIKSYLDNDGNTYRVERASNGMFICVRVNAGGNRKGFRPVGAGSKQAAARNDLDVVTEANGWRDR